jgi:hypothetical protein
MEEWNTVQLVSVAEAIETFFTEQQALALAGSTLRKLRSFTKSLCSRYEHLHRAFNHPRGRNAKLCTAARTRRYHLIVSVPIIREIAEVLRRDFGWREPDLRRRIR